MEDIFKKIDAHIEEEEALFDSGRDDAYHRIQGILWVKTLLMDSTNAQPEDSAVCTCGSKKLPILHAPIKGFKCQDCGKIRG